MDNIWLSFNYYIPLSSFFHQFFYLLFRTFIFRKNKESHFAILTLFAIMFYQLYCLFCVFVSFYPYLVRRLANFTITTARYIRTSTRIVRCICIWNDWLRYFLRQLIYQSWFPRWCSCWVTCSLLVNVIYFVFSVIYNRNLIDLIKIFVVTINQFLFGCSPDTLEHFSRHLSIKDVVLLTTFSTL